MQIGDAVPLRRRRSVAHQLSQRILPHCQIKMIESMLQLHIGAGLYHHKISLLSGELWTIIKWQYFSI